MSLKTFVHKLKHVNYVDRIFDPIAEKVFGVRLMQPRRVGVIFEQVHLKRFLPHYQVDCVFDVGANEGQYAKMVRRTGYKGPIISFEPVPRALEKLRKNAKHDPNWYVEGVALDGTARQTTFKVMAIDQFSSLNTPSDRETGETLKKSNTVVSEIPVQTVTLKEMYDKYQAKLGFKRPYLKMDTQGSDLTIAQGSERVLHHFVGIQSEVSIKKLYEGVPDYTELIEFYRSKGFELSAFVPNNAGTFPYLIETDIIMYNKGFDAERAA
ncbi:FkbM family methyltransferase [Candidatus Kaiserbacteria bacterium]|nr:FkbM family methyltransferase [Candidatus Kaiserbacteria bacterium]